MYLLTASITVLCVWSPSVWAVVSSSVTREREKSLSVAKEFLHELGVHTLCWLFAREFRSSLIEPFNINISLRRRREKVREF